MPAQLREVASRPRRAVLAPAKRFPGGRLEQALESASSSYWPVARVPVASERLAKGVLLPG
jgi:hypothetical protein